MQPNIHVIPLEIVEFNYFAFLGYDFVNFKQNATNLTFYYCNKSFFIATCAIFTTNHEKNLYKICVCV